MSCQAYHIDLVYNMSRVTLSLVPRSEYTRTDKPAWEEDEEDKEREEVAALITSKDERVNDFCRI